MLIACNVLKEFCFSEDGINATDADVGDVAMIPEQWVSGLLDAGFIALANALKNKIVAPAGEIGATVPLAAPPHPLDRDGNGRKGGSLPRPRGRPSKAKG